MSFFRTLKFSNGDTNFSSTCFKDCYDHIEFRCHNMNKCNKTLTFPILKQYYTNLSSNFIIYSNEKSLSVGALARYLRCSDRAL